MSSRLTRFRRYAITASLTMCLWLSKANADEVVEFEIPAQEAVKGLNLYARQADLQILFPYAAVKGLRTNEVVGALEKDIALETLLADTGLEVVYGSNNTATVRPIEPVSQSSREPQTPGKSGPASSPVPMAQNQAPASRNAMNPTTDSDDEQKRRRSIEEIVITGSRIRGAQNASPVVTITREDIDLAGFATVEELVDKLPQNFGAGASLDFKTDPTSNRENFVGGFVESLGGGSTSVNLRGLGASSTLILLNGHRISPSGRSARFTNISAIPITAIERVEILTDGASAIYGSDAIAGVVNFILREDYEGVESRLHYGSDSGGDTSNILFGQAMGTSWDSGNVLLSYEYYNSANLANRDRDITSTNDLSRFGGTDRRTPGGRPANIVAGAQTFAIPAGQDGTSLTSADFDENAPLNLFNNRSLGDVLPELARHSTFLHLTQAIGAVEFFAQAQFSSQETQTINSRGTFTFNVPNSNPFFVDPTDTGLTTVTVENYAFEEDLPSIGFGEVATFGAVMGMRLDIGENWNGELVGNWSKEEAESGRELTIDRDVLDAAVNETDPNLAFNPFGDGPMNPAIRESIIDARDVGNQAENELWSVSLIVDGKAFDVPGGTAQVAAGIEFREDSLLSVGNPGPQAETSDTSRDVLAVYTEFFFPLVSASNSRPGLQRLELSVAGRYEDYSDFGSSINPKVGLVWSPTQSLTIRGTYGTSFRAPALFDLDVSSLTGNASAYIPEAFVPALVPFPLLFRVGGNEDLNAEEADTWTAGFQWNPVNITGLSLDVTYFNVNFENRIDVPTNNFFGAIVDPRFATLLNTNPTPEQIAALVDDPRYRDTFLVTTPAADLLSGAAPVSAIFDVRKTNLSQSVVTGVELQLAYQFETAFGLLDMGLNGNYLFGFEQRFIAADPIVDEVDTYGRPVDLKLRGNVTWSHQGWTASGFINHMDDYTDNISDPAKPIDSWTTLDLTIAYNIGDDKGLFSDTRLTLAAQNLFDKAPPFVDTPGGTAYDSANGNPMGRFMAFQITKEW